MKGNRYSVPLGTYDGTSKEVGYPGRMSPHLHIYDLDTGEILAEHERSHHDEASSSRIRITGEIARKALLLI